MKHNPNNPSIGGNALVANTIVVAASRDWLKKYGAHLAEPHIVVANAGSSVSIRNMLHEGARAVTYPRSALQRYFGQIVIQDGRVLGYEEPTL